jgi:hypothetical protein
VLNLKYSKGDFIESSMTDLFGKVPDNIEYDEFIKNSGLTDSDMFRSYDPDGDRPFIRTYAKTQEGSCTCPFIIACSLDGCMFFYVGADTKADMCLAILKLIPIVAGSELLHSAPK